MKELTTQIQNIWQHDPEAPIYLTADSSGCGIALAAIAALPANVHVCSLVLASPAVSPSYNLVPTLEHIDGHIFSFSSRRDLVILCLGTRIFGTVDGHHTSGAGRVGFKIQPAAPSYARLRQFNYDPKWESAYGYDGGHSKALSPFFAKAFIAPLLQNDVGGE